MDWQTAAVIAIEACAVGFLVRRLAVGRRARSGPGAGARPDVPTTALVRRRR